MGIWNLNRRPTSQKRHGDKMKVGQAVRPSPTLKYMKESFKKQKINRISKVKHKKIPQTHGGKMLGRQMQQHTRI